MEQVILIDTEDTVIGAEEKLMAHRRGLLHRAFSVLIFNSKKEMLLQKRATTKYHSGGLWTNACCGHPRPGEDTMSAAHRRLQEEMGFECELGFLYKFTYRAQLGEFTEHECDHVFVGYFDGIPEPDPAEAEGWTARPVREIIADAERNPERYTFWFRLILENSDFRKYLSNL